MPVTFSAAWPVPDRPSFRERKGPLVTEQGKEYALAQLEARKAENRAIIRPDNDRFPAGSPMYFYCDSCDDLADRKPESYNPRTNPVKLLCVECEALKEKGWLPQRS